MQRRAGCAELAAVEWLQSGRREGARVQTRVGRRVHRGTATVASKAGHPATAAVATTAAAAVATAAAAAVAATATAAVAATAAAAAATAAAALTTETGHPSAVTAAATHATAHATAAHATAAPAAPSRRRHRRRRRPAAAAAAARRGAVRVCEVLAAVAEQQVEQQRLPPLVHVWERAHLYGHKRALLGLRACPRGVTAPLLGSGGVGAHHAVVVRVQQVELVRAQLRESKDGGREHARAHVSKELLQHRQHLLAHVARRLRVLLRRRRRRRAAWRRHELG